MQQAIPAQAGGDYAMTSHSTTPDLPQSETETVVHLFDNWFDPIEAGFRDRIHELLQAMLEAELDQVLERSRYARRAKRSSDDSEGPASVTGHRGHRSRTLLGTFGQVKIAVPRARLDTPDGKTTEWKSQALRAYQRRTETADALIAGCYLSGTNTRRVRRAPRASRAACSVWRRGRQRHGEPGLAQGEERLGGLECPLAGR
jgi:putative transposase